VATERKQEKETRRFCIDDYIVRFMVNGAIFVSSAIISTKM